MWRAVQWGNKALCCLCVACGTAGVVKQSAAPYVWWVVLRGYQSALRTDLLILGDAHDLHGLQRLREEVLVMLARDGQVAVGNEAVVAVALQTQLG